MKFLKSAAALSVAAILSLAVTACAGSAPQPSGAADASGEAIVQLANVSGATVHLDEGTTEATVEVEIKDGEALVVMADFEENEGEVTATSYKDGVEYSTDYFYEGLGYSETGAIPGTYRVEINAGGAKGTMWVLAYPANQIDVMTMSLEDIFDQVLSNVS